MRRLLRFAIPILVVAIAFVAMRALLASRPERSRQPAPPRELSVNTQVAKVGPERTEILAYGRVRSGQPIELFSEVTGVLEPGDGPFRPGHRFASGAVLLRVDDRSMRLRIASRKSQFLTALAGLLPEIKVDFSAEYPAWGSYFERFELEGGMGDLPETENGRVRLALARNRIHEIYYDIREMEIQLEKHVIVAPFAGVVTDAALREGATVRPGSRLGGILSLDDLEVQVSLPAADLHWLERGGKVQLRSAELDGRWTARIARIGGSVQATTETVPVYLSIDEIEGPATLVDGTFLEARFPGRTLETAVSLPQEALQGDATVYLLAGGRLTPRAVDVARREERRVLISGGLANGDSVVTDLLQGVVPGMPARPRGGGGTP